MRPTGSPGQGVTLRMNGATTALGRSLEGVLKLGLRLGLERRTAASRRTLARLEALAPGLEASFSRLPSLEPFAVASGNVPGTDQPALLQALRDVGAEANLAAETATLLQALASELAADRPEARGLFRMQTGDFPIGTFSEGPDGSFRWVAPDGTVVNGKAGAP
jgi:hypothetical protein